MYKFIKFKMSPLQIHINIRAFPISHLLNLYKNMIIGTKSGKFKHCMLILSKLTPLPIPTPLSYPTPRPTLPT